MLTSRASRRGALRAVAGCSLLAAALLIAACASTQQPFPNYEFRPPASQYDGPLFKLSQDYPTRKPPATELPAFFKTDFRKDWRAYMMQVRDYCLAGNTAVDWRVERNTLRRWYHMPWQHSGAAGREAIHGLTKEAPIRPFQLAASQTYPDGAAYAVGIYNSFGAYAIGRVWKNHEHPDPAYAATQGFPIGTVVCKPLFVSIPPAVVAQQIPFLADPIEWKAYATVTSRSEERKVQDVTLIQLDFMVRDSRAPSGWIFGTFQYNGALGNRDRWRNLAPVGVMWGNDPEDSANIPVTDAHGNFPASPAVTATPINAGLEETIINPDSSELPPTHLGWNGRLDGPVDNPLSSCMSCHMTASSPEQPLSPVFTPLGVRPTSGTPEWNDWWMQWFQNVGWKDGVLEGFRTAKHPLDFGLQLSAALQNFYQSQDGIKPKYRVRR